MDRSGTLTMRSPSLKRKFPAHDVEELILRSVNVTGGPLFAQWFAEPGEGPSGSLA